MRSGWPFASLAPALIALPSAVTVGASVDELLEAAGALWEETLEKEREEEEARLEAARGECPLALPRQNEADQAQAEAAAAKLGKKVLTPEEEAARKADLLKVRAEFYFGSFSSSPCPPRRRTATWRKTRSHHQTRKPSRKPTRTRLSSTPERSRRRLAGRPKLAWVRRATDDCARASLTLSAVYRPLHAAQHERCHRQGCRGAEAEGFGGSGSGQA